jgi:hypothetical protein
MVPVCADARRWGVEELQQPLPGGRRCCGTSRPADRRCGCVCCCVRAAKLCHPPFGLAHLTFLGLCGGQAASISRWRRPRSQPRRWWRPSERATSPRGGSRCTNSDGGRPSGGTFGCTNLHHHLQRLRRALSCVIRRLCRVRVARVVSNVRVSMCRSFLILRLLYRFPILLDAAAEVIKRKGDAFVGAWATVLLAARYCFSLVRSARSELDAPPGNDGRPEQDLVLLSHLVRVHTQHARTRA